MMRCVLLCAVVAASGCVNLQSVSRFAKVSAATADSDAAVADYVGSLERQRRMLREDQRAELDAQISTRREQQKRLFAAQQVLVEYLNVLGALAADDLPIVEAELDALRGSLSTAKFVGDGDAQLGTATADAAVAITGLLARVVTDFARQADIKKLLLAADQPFAAVIAGLREVFDRDLRAQLENEREATRKRFKAWEASAKASKDEDGAAPVARLMLEERQMEINAREARINAYVAALDTIGKGHAELVKNASKLDTDDLKKKLQGLTENVKKSFNSIKKLVTE